MTKRVASAAYFAVLLACFQGAFAQTNSLTAVRLVPSDLEWSEADDGLSLAPIAGNPGTPGMYVTRVRFPTDFRVQPHFHPDNRTVIVISGTLHVGFGRQFDEGAMKELPPGSTWTEPAGQPHFAWAKDGEVVIQVVGIGPSGRTSVSTEQ